MMPEKRNIAGEIVIRPIEPADQQPVKDLILAGLEEHWGYIDFDLNPDLNDIISAYADGYFVVAERQGRIIGTGAILPVKKGYVRIVRMTVDRSFRRRGVGRRILTALLQLALQMGARRIVLETTASWHDAVQFYLSCGFQPQGIINGDQYFLLNCSSEKRQISGA